MDRLVRAHSQLVGSPMSSAAGAGPTTTDELARELLDRTQLVSMTFLAVSMERKDGDPQAEDASFPVNIQIGLQLTDDGAAYRVGFSVDRPDLSASVTVGLLYRSEKPSDFDTDEAARAFGELVALPAAYPYARSKLQEITVDSGTAPVLLGLLDLTRATPWRFNQSDSSAQQP